MKVQCCKCKRMKIDGRWRFASVHIHGPISHGYCPDCADSTRLEHFCEQASRATKSRANQVHKLLCQQSA
jgi:hypothetical protein